MSNGDRFQQLCQAQIEGAATEEEQAEFAEMLRLGGSERRSYLKQMRMHAMLTWRHGRSQGVITELRPPANVISWPSWRWAAAAATVLILAGLAAWWQLSYQNRGESIEVLAAADVPFRVGDRVNGRTVQFERGSLSFRMTSGAVIELAGPSQLELVSPMHLRLIRGSVTADISKGSKGFVIETAQARVVDLGTRFGVTAGSSNRTDVAVFQGKVEVYDGPGEPSALQPKVTLTEGEAIRVKSTTQSQRLKMVRLGQGADSLRGDGGSDLVSDVEDNAAESDSHRYYGLVRGGMGEGARVYTTGSSRRWHPTEGAAFPEELIGADIICTFSDDRRDASLKITLHLNQPCDLYIMADARAPAPAWLAESFADTGIKLRSGPWIPRGTPPEKLPAYAADETMYVPYTVWKKRVAGPGTAELGSPFAKAPGIRLGMYGIAVKKAE